ncbi:hypothetical protein ACJX0J_020888, partial [Zea mays]
MIVQLVQLVPIVTSMNAGTQFKEIICTFFKVPKQATILHVIDVWDSIASNWWKKGLRIDGISLCGHDVHEDDFFIIDISPQILFLFITSISWFIKTTMLLTLRLLNLMLYNKYSADECISGLFSIIKTWVGHLAEEVYKVLDINLLYGVFTLHNTQHTQSSLFITSSGAVDSATHEAPHVAHCYTVVDLLYERVAHEKRKRGNRNCGLQAV